MTTASPSAPAVAAGRNPLAAIALAIAIGTAPADIAAARDPDAAARNEAAVRAAFDSWAAGSGNVFDLLSPDVRWTIHGSGPVAGTYAGLEEFVQRASLPLVSRLATPLVPRVHHIWASDESVVIRFDASATTTGGDPYSNRFVWIFRMEDGSVVEAEAFLDLVAYQDAVARNEPRRQ